MNELIYPKRILGAEGIDTGLLMKKQPPQIGLKEHMTTEFSKGDYAIFDFGEELCGGVRILTYKSADAPVRIRFGESLTECYSDVGGSTGATNDHSLRDFTVQLPQYSDMTLGQTGFRFVRLDFGGTVKLKSVLATNQILKKKEIYRYEGDDARLHEIYKAAKRTVDLCASSGYIWDGVKRDRLVWIGDMAPEVLALATLYGRLPCVERSLDFSKGLFPLPMWMNNMPAYSMWWIIILADYYERTGSRAYVERQMPYLEGLLRQMERCIAEDGELNYPSYFVDWPTHGQPDEIMGVRAINIYAMRRAITLLSALDRDTALAEELLSRLVKVEIVVQSSKQVLGLKYFATGLNEADKQALVLGGAKGMSTFMSYYILKAVASFDRERAIEMMKEFYGAMLDKGATTFWEDFNMEWAENSCRIDELPKEGEKDIHGDFGAFCYVGHRHSLCHGWSAGVLAFMKEENL